jgi:indolepyruvate ferredoxin oxidoreductase
VQPVHTEFGRKTRIHQPSCNSDLSCLDGDCPSFLLVEPGTRAARGRPELPVALVEPRPRFGERDVLVRMPGIGGTGVVTASKILQMAAHLDGRFAAGLEQIGLAQKGGPVVSDVRISKTPVVGSLRASRGTADVLVGFDLLGTADPANLGVCVPDRTVAVVNSAVVPTAAMITGRVVLPGSPDDALERIAAVTAEQVHLDAQRLSEQLFGDHMPTNVVLLGAAYQAGVLPVSAAALEEAIRLNGAAVENTLAAFRWGRAAVQDGEAVRAAVEPPARQTVPVDAAARAQADRIGLAEVLAVRIADLTGYQDAAYAARYAAEVGRVRELAAAAAGQRIGDRIGLAYARGLHKLMAYKDEYEVARLHLDPVEAARRAEVHGADARVSVLLHPPVLRALGMNRKIRLRATATPAFRALRAARRLRGTALDVFGYAGVRRTERELVGEYRALVRHAVARLDPGTADLVEEIAGLPDLVRGYEEIKMAGVARFRERAAELTARLGPVAE